MKVKIGNEIYDSYDQPIAVLLTSDDEIEAAKRLNGKSRALGSFPLNTDPIKAHLFLSTGWEGLSFKVVMNAREALDKIPLPEVPTIRGLQS